MEMPLLLERKYTQEQNLSASEIIAQLRQLEQKIRENEAVFNMTLEDDLLEACIYDGKALRSRYRYYHNMARRMGIKAGELR
ncbi:MAG: hypothetical protein IJP15_03035 [Oscillospiraceae bacterium]|nr:hypothetical protein [Oscillospiraceae bacterium]